MISALASVYLGLRVVSREELIVNSYENCSLCLWLKVGVGIWFLSLFLYQLIPVSFFFEDWMLLRLILELSKEVLSRDAVNYHFK